MIRLVCLLIFLAGPLAAEVLVASRTIPAQSIISPGDIVYRDMAAVNGITDPNEIIGKEARVALFAGRPIRSSDVGIPAVVDRNQIIPLLFERGGLVIKTDGRALDRAGPGDMIRVMNLSSRTTVTATIDDAGVAHVRN